MKGTYVLFSNCILCSSAAYRLDRIEQMLSRIHLVGNSLHD